MTIDISKHYFGYYANTGETESLAGFRVGEIVIDWYGETGCILQIYKSGEVRTDSNGMGDIAKLKKTRNRKRIEEYLKDLHEVDMRIIQRTHANELRKLTA